MHLSKNQRKFAQRRQVGTWKWLKEGRCQESIGIEGVDLSETTGEPKKRDKKLSLQEPAAVPKKNTRFTTSFQADVEKQWGSLFSGILQFDLGTKLEVFRCIKNLKFLNFKAKMVSCYWMMAAFQIVLSSSFHARIFQQKHRLPTCRNFQWKEISISEISTTKNSNPFGTSGCFQK